MLQRLGPYLNPKGVIGNAAATILVLPGGFS